MEDGRQRDRSPLKGRLYGQSVRSALFIALWFLPVVLSAQSDPFFSSLNQPVKPFRIAGNLYYVGASDVTSFLLTTPEGHILIDGGFEQTAGQIERNIEELGFHVADIRIILNSHAHLDHAGGLALLKRASGARFLASAREIPLLARGGLDDPQYGNRLPFPPIRADGIVNDGTPVRIGGTELVAHITAGHTPGCTTWTTKLREGPRMLDVVFLCSMSVPSEYKLVGNRRYPDAVADYRAQFSFLRSLKPDIFLASHGSFFGLKEKVALLRAGAEAPFVDPKGYERLISLMEQRFEAAVTAQSAAGN